MRSAVAAFLFVVILTTPSSSQAASPTVAARYYILLFGGQADLLRPSTAHVWATYVKLSCNKDGTETLEQHTISWLPESGVVYPLAIRAEPGRNYGFAETMKYMSGRRQRIALWGPYEISERRYCEAKKQKAKLESGVVQYKVNDWFDRNPDIEHCLHGLTSAHPDLEYRTRVVRGIGESATAPVASAMLSIGMIRNPKCTEDWLLPLLGLDTMHLVRRTAGDGVLFQR